MTSRLELFRSWYLFGRDVGLTGLGVGIIVHEVALAPEPRALALGIAGSILGLIPVLRKEER